MFFFFFNDTATTEIYTLSLHDALPINAWAFSSGTPCDQSPTVSRSGQRRSEEHTSELQSRSELVCRLLLEKNKNQCAEVAEAERGAPASDARSAGLRARPDPRFCF